jgi:hypothetical protein
MGIAVLYVDIARRQPEIDIGSGIACLISDLAFVLNKGHWNLAFKGGNIGLRVSCYT